MHTPPTHTTPVPLYTRAHALANIHVSKHRSARASHSSPQKMRLSALLANLLVTVLQPTEIKRGRPEPISCEGEAWGGTAREHAAVQQGL